MRARLAMALLALLIAPLLLTHAAWGGERVPCRLDVMKAELLRNFEALKKEETPPYYIGYTIDHLRTRQAHASFGALMEKSDDSWAFLTIDVRVGSYALDNTHEIRGDGYSRYRSLYMPIQRAPLDESPEALRVMLWQKTDEAYKSAVETLSKVKSDKSLKVEEEDTSGDFSPSKPSVSLEEPLRIETDLDKWSQRVRAYTAPFRKYPYILQADAHFSSEVRTKYFVSSEGAMILAPLNYMRLMIYATAKAEDGMELPLYLSYFAARESDLPDHGRVLADIDGMLKTLERLRSAPLVEPYTGPAILSGKASGVFFHEILGHRLEGHRQKSEEEGQTFKKKVNQRILPDFISVVFDPTIAEFGGLKLSGSYRFDDEGTKAEKVTALENGVLKSFLMTRSPIRGFPASNAHARCQPGHRPVARQSNLIVLSERRMPEKALREELIAELKRQGKPFGLYFAEIEGGFTMTGRVIPNAFSVLPLVVYKVYADGRPDELVRGVDLIGTPLVTFEKIVATGDELQAFNGICGAESGGVPVSAVSPSILVTQVEVQKKARSQEKTPILPPPAVETPRAPRN